jgi:hypothetical protein
MEVSFAGYFLTGFSLTASPAVTYEAASTDSLPLSTFPVAANSCSLLMADRITFGHIGGFDPRMFSGVCDIDFGMRVIDAGFINLNTVGASAYATQIKPRGRYDVDLSRRLPHLDLNRLRSLTTVVRRVL